MKSTPREVPLGAVCDVIGGGTPSRRVAAYYEGDIPWVTVRDMSVDTIEDTECHITSEAVRRSSTNIIPSGNVVIATRVGLGKIGVLSQDAAINQDLRGVIPKNLSELRVRYLFWWLKSIADHIVGAGQGATVQGVKLPFVKSLRLPLPEQTEQDRIVAILDEAFNDIGATVVNAERNLGNATCVFESYLESVFGQDDDSPLVTIGDVAEVFDGPHATPRTVDAGPVFLGISALQDGEINLGRTRHVTPDDFLRWTRRVLPQADDVVFSYETRLGQAAAIPKGLECCLGRRMGLVRLDRRRVDPWYFVYQYVSPPFRRFLESRTIHGATVDRIALKEFPTFRVKLPPLPEQEHVADGIRQLKAESQRLESVYQRKLDALDALKESLLHEAFSGNL